MSTPTYWKPPHINKVYEAITAIADKRIVQEPDAPHKAKCYSSSGNKFYEIELDPTTLAMMSNDNSAYYTDSLSYPMIALLMLNGHLERSSFLEEALSGIYWKDINQKYKNDYDRSIEHVLTELKEKGVDTTKVEEQIAEIYEKVIEMKIEHLGKKETPPSGY